MIPERGWLTPGGERVLGKGACRGRGSSLCSLAKVLVDGDKVEARSVGVGEMKLRPT